MTIHHTSKSFSNDGQLPCFLAIQKQNKSSSASGPHNTDLFYSENNREWLAQKLLSRKQAYTNRNRFSVLSLGREWQYLVLLLQSVFKMSALSNSTISYSRTIKLIQHQTNPLNMSVLQLNRYIQESQLLSCIQLGTEPLG